MTGQLPVAQLWLDRALLQPEECLQLRNADSLEILGVVSCGLGLLGLLDLLSLQVCLQKSASMKVLRKERVVLWLLMWSGIFWGPTWSRRNCVPTGVTFSDQPLLKFSAESSSCSESLKLEEVSSSER